jgi:hypothetical protein
METNNNELENNKEEQEKGELKIITELTIT